MADRINGIKVGDVRHGDWQNFEQRLLAAGLDVELLLAAASNPQVARAMMDAGNGQMEEFPELVVKSGEWSSSLRHGMFISVHEQLRVLQKLGWANISEWFALEHRKGADEWHPSRYTPNVLIPTEGSPNKIFYRLIKGLGRQPPGDFEIESDETLTDASVMIQRISLERRVDTINFQTHRREAAGLGVVAALVHFPRWRASLLRRLRGPSARFWLLGCKLNKPNVGLRATLVSGDIWFAAVPFVDMHSADFYPLIVKST